MSEGFLGQGYLLIALLVILGGSLLIVSVVFNLRVADSVRHDARHREKLLEYYRNIVSQLGVILIGIGVSLFIFFFQQSFQESKRRETETQAAAAKLSVRVSRAAAIMEGLNEFDVLLDEGGPYIGPENGGANAAVTKSGPELLKQAQALFLIERDVDQRAFEVLAASKDFETTFIARELNAQLWFNMVKDEADLGYAVAQLGQDYADLHREVDGLNGGEPTPEQEAAVKREVLDVFYDADLLRQRSRKLLGRACWLLSKGNAFVSSKPEAAIETDAPNQKAWLEQAMPVLSKVKVGQRSCYDLLAAPT
ncbi:MULTISPECIES: hypothetical protein [Mesorhizobium]|uniref:Uncharacterized protein n=1 Tax=Mesorhizobium denitrificans TaxID=2294114 RepID=A0A371XFL7_9HYPH|nr:MULTISPECIES: hypothetical protein [Mesorhizobium]RFC68026.1 hypothetical protein DY251_06960 [Mesorhizobium denitrificans]